MHVAVVLVSCDDAPRRTAFNRAWAEKCVKVSGDYLTAQSGGRVTLTWQVFDWLEMPLSHDEWVAASGAGINVVLPVLTPPDVDLLQDFDHVLVVIDSSGSSGGTTPGAYTYLAATNFTPSFIGHELGHRFGAADAFGKRSAGRRIYENSYCVMGAMGWPYTTSVPALVDSQAPMLDRAGPGMSAPSLMATGWLDVGQHNVATDLTASAGDSFGAPAILSVLTGAPGVAWGGPPVVVRCGPYVIEYRLPSDWDKGIPAPPAGASGWLVVHHAPTNKLEAEFVDQLAVAAGAALSVEPINALDLDSPGLLTIRVLSVDTASRVVQLWIHRRPARGGPAEVPMGEVLGDGGDGGSLVFTYGRGWRRIPPYSPLFDVIEMVDEIAELHEVAHRVPVELRHDVDRRISSVLETLRHTVSEVPVEAPRPPLEQALDTLSALEEARARVAEQGVESGVAQEYLEMSRADLEQVRAIVASAIERQQR